MYKTCRVKLRPKKTQIVYFEKNIGCCRFVYNNSLKYCIDQYEANKNLPKEERKGRPGSFALQTRVAELKKAHDFLTEVDSQALKFAAAQVDIAFKHFFRRLKTGGAPGFPRYKAKNKAKASFTLTQGSVIRWTERSLILPKAGEVALDRSNWSPPSTTEGMSLRRVTVTRDACKHYYASVLFGDGKPEPAPLELSKETKTKNMIVLDLGLKVLFKYEDSNGKRGEIASPRFLRSKLGPLARAQQKLSRCEHGSGRQEKKRLRLARISGKIKNKRHQFFLDVVNDLIKEYSCIVVEDLEIAKIKAGNAGKADKADKQVTGKAQSNINRAFADQALGEFVRILEYKCLMNRTALIKIGNTHRPNKTCSNCGIENESVSMEDKRWACKHCGIEHERSENCLRNLRKLAMEEIDKA